MMRLESLAGAGCGGRPTPRVTTPLQQYCGVLCARPGLLALALRSKAQGLLPSRDRPSDADRRARVASEMDLHGCLALELPAAGGLFAAEGALAVCSVLQRFGDAWWARTNGYQSCSTLGAHSCVGHPDPPQRIGHRLTGS